jgi:hypothetical protein
MFRRFRPDLTNTGDSANARFGKRPIWQTPDLANTQFGKRPIWQLPDLANAPAWQISRLAKYRDNWKIPG